VAVISTILVITRTNAVHALLYLIVSLLAVALLFFALGAPFVAALEVIIYAGAIMVLFIFVIMMLNLGGQAAKQEALLLTPGICWSVNHIMVLAAKHLSVRDRPGGPLLALISPEEIGIALFSPYVIGVELACRLLAGLVGAYHLGRPHRHGKAEGSNP
jgi:NADH-quinone oxidoreductase subunit J